VYFLTARATKLFTVTFAPYVVLFILWLTIFKNNADGRDSFLFSLLIYVSASASTLFYLAWQYHAFKFFVRYAKLSHTLRTLFNVSLSLNALIFFSIMTSALVATSPAQGFTDYQVSVAVKDISILLLLTTSMLVAKVLVTAEKRSRANILEYASTALLIIFFPFGVWKVQPRILRLRKLAAEQTARRQLNAQH
jgi:hypothetical protein